MNESCIKLTVQNLSYTEFYNNLFVYTRLQLCWTWNKHIIKQRHCICSITYQKRGLYEARVLWHISKTFDIERHLLYSTFPKRFGA
jgi:hypothetical protein